MISDDVLKEYKDIPYNEFVGSFTAKTGKTKRMLYNEYHPYLDKHKNSLISRKIKPFNESNRRQRGRGYYKSDKKRIYVNGKTRNNNPFFTHECKNYDGSILAIFPHNQNLDVKELCEELNKINWAELGFVCDGRFLFSQKSLENTKLPNTFRKYVLTNRLF